MRLAPKTHFIVSYRLNLRPHNHFDAQTLWFELDIV